MKPTYDEIIKWLRTENSKELEQLWKMANQTRQENVGDEIHLRGLIEISNTCCRSCTYCGLNALMPNIDRYRMTTEDVMECVKKAQDFGYGTVVIQGGEDYGITKEWIIDIIKQIKQQTDLAITLSLGERTPDELKAWKEAGADRYLLRFETSDPKLYNLIHPALPNSDPARDRAAILRELKEIGYEAGSGVMVGIPGQTYDILARDILLFGELDLDMIGIGPFLPHPETPLGKEYAKNIDKNNVNQVPNTELMTYKTVALARLVRPSANIPSTTALATINKGFGREFGLMRGANVVMPNLTQLKYREKYMIYPNKVCITEEAEACDKCMQLRIGTIGRKIGIGKGGRKK